MNELHNLPLDRLAYDRQIASWQHTEPSGIDRIEGNDPAAIKQLTEEHAQARLALQRRDHLAEIAASAWPPVVKHILSWAVGFFGAMVIGAGVGAIVDSTGRGPIAATGGAIAGGACAVLTERYSARYMMKRGMRYQSLQVLECIQAELADRPQPTEFERHYYASQEKLLQQVETTYLAKEPKSEQLMAIAAICTEGVVSLILTLPAGLPLALASATFPIIINLLVAKVQSDRFEVPEACEGLIPIYEAHIPSESIPALEALQIVRLDAGIQYVASTRPPKGIRSVGQSKGLAQMHFAQAQITVLEGQGVRAIADREQRYQQTKEALPTRCPNPEIDVTGLTADEAKQVEQEWRDRWLETELHKLAETRKTDLELIQAEYGRAIAYWRYLESQGAQEYRDSEPDDNMPKAA